VSAACSTWWTSSFQAAVRPYPPAARRVEEFARHGWDPRVVPDPQDPATFERSKLDWSELSHGRHAVLLDVYRQLALLRRALPELTDPAFSSLGATADEETRVFTLRRGRVVIVINFSDAPVTVPESGTLLFTTPSAATVGADGTDLPAHAGLVLSQP
jgi:maltooligosyltrehalose trehalohydrolase